MPRSLNDDGQTVRVAVTQTPAPRATAASRITLFNPLMPGECNLTVYRGDSYEWIIALQDGAGNGVPITGWTFRAEIRVTQYGRLMAEMQVVERNDLTGVIILRLASDQSRYLSSNGVWDLQYTHTDGWVRTIMYGTVTVVDDVTTGVVDYEAVR